MERNAGPTLLEILKDPALLLSLHPLELDRVLRSARRLRLLSRLAVMAETARVAQQLDPRIADRLVAARMRASQHERVIRWEVNRISRALSGTGVRIILLKGAAYAMAGLPPARGRLASDVDILVPSERLDDVEKALADAGWETNKPDPYDQRYYREWMHELPPLQHRDRKNLLDVHHTIVPLTGRLHPDPEKIRSAVRRLGDQDLWVLSPEDMLLHAATHMFHDDDFSGSLRDLFDLHDLFVHFSDTEEGFWERLTSRASEQEQGRPLFYALRYCRRLLGTPSSEGAELATRSWRPSFPVLALMDALVVRALTGDLETRKRPGTGLAQWLVYARAHWLRMPVRLLVPHLIRKSLRGLFSKRSPGA